MLPMVDLHRIGLEPGQLDLPPSTVDLSLDEVRRLERFRHVADRVRFAMGRQLLRRVLGEKLDLPPREVPIRIETSGRPVLDLPPSSRSGPVFSLAHSGLQVVLAVRSDGPVGLDVESADKRIGPVSDLLHRVAAPGEFERWQQTDPSARAFLRMWTAKEAVAKARGRGLADDLRQIIVSPPSAPGTASAARGLLGRGWATVELPTGSESHLCTLAVPLDGLAAPDAADALHWTDHAMSGTVQ